MPHLKEPFHATHYPDTVGDILTFRLAVNQKLVMYLTR